MTNTNIYISSPRNLDRSQQLSRVVLAAALLGITISAPAGALGWLSVLPLVAIYPLVTGLLGWDPVYDVFGIEHRHQDGKLHGSSRMELAVTGVALIGSVFVLPEVVHPIFSVLALAGIYPAVSALTGEDLLQSTGTREVHIGELQLGAQPRTAEGTHRAMTAIDQIRKARNAGDQKKVA